MQLDEAFQFLPQIDLMKTLLALWCAAVALASPTKNLAPLSIPSNVYEVIPNEYIVQLRKPDSSFAAGDPHAHVDAHLAKIFPELFEKHTESVHQSNPLLHKYLSGYAAVMDDETLMRVRQSADVEFVEVNQVVYAFDKQEGPENWGLDRISHHKKLKHEYLFPSSAGEGVDVYVVDTGVNIAHEDFEGRAAWGLTAPVGDPDEDGNGHGTHVASTIAGAKYGVAKHANIIAVKVLRSSGYGSMSDVLKGVEWAMTEHQRKTKTNSDPKRKIKSVANMSLGGGKSFALDRAVNRAVQEGVLFAVAAGNDNRDACSYSPAASDEAITVGATSSNDARSWFSNWGKCVDIFAPGSDITAAWIGSKTAVKTISGTSMASPHVCGVMALVLAENPDFTPAELKEHVLSMANEEMVKNPGKKSPNLLLYNGGEKHKHRDGETVPEMPDVKFSITIEDLDSKPAQKHQKTELQSIVAEIVRIFVF